jgi:hypothetical protein
MDQPQSPKIWLMILKPYSSKYGEVAAYKKSPLSQ